MKVGIASVQVPFISGGAEILADGLAEELRKRDIEADVITIPFKWYPPSHILELIDVVDKLDITEVNGVAIDRLVTLKFPMYYVRHPNKVAWLLHQHRQAYDLYGTPFGDLHHDADGIEVAETIRRLDRDRLGDHRAIYTISRTVTERLTEHSGLASEVLYPPPEDQELFTSGPYGDYILAPGRLDGIKRQQLAIEAMAHVSSDVRLVIIGNDQTEYGAEAHQLASRLGLEGRVEFRGVVSREEKLNLYSGALAVYNGVHNEDYGYVTIEGFLAAKAVIAHVDAGGPLEFITDGVNGFITEPEPVALGGAMSALAQPGAAERLGVAGSASLADHTIGWDHVIERLLG